MDTIACLKKNIEASIKAKQQLLNDSESLLIFSFTPVLEDK